jgi:Putative peptidoglycan binding domain
MKKLICSVCVSGLVLATTALGQDKNHGNGVSVGAGVHRSGAGVRSAAPAISHQGMNSPSTGRYISRAPFRTRTYAETPRTTVHNRAVVRNSTVNTRTRTYRNPTVRNNMTNGKVRETVALNRQRSFARNRNVRVGSNVAVNRNRNAVVTNNWRSDRFRGQSYAAFRNYHRQWHDRGWWRSHYDHIVFVGGGWWYWNAGYWFPAWGYDASAYYPYDGPIYGYSNLTPYQVVANVQTQLADDGYYAGPIDGTLGPMTRQALAAFQADNGLAVTSTVDEPTMATLGLS